LGSFGAAAALAVLALRGGAPAGEPAHLVSFRVAAQACLLSLGAMAALATLVRGRVLAKHGRAWRRPERVHLGLALGLAGAGLVAAPFDFEVWVVVGPALGVAGFAAALTGGAQRELDPALERALQRAGLRPTLRAV